MGDIPWIENLKKLSKSILSILYLLEKEAQIHFNNLSSTTTMNKIEQKQKKTHWNKIEKCIISFISKSSIQLEKLRCMSHTVVVKNKTKSELDDNNNIITTLQLKLH